MNGSALHEAVMYGKVEVIKLLTQSGNLRIWINFLLTIRSSKLPKSVLNGCISFVTVFGVSKSVISHVTLSQAHAWLPLFHTDWVWSNDFQFAKWSVPNYSIILFSLLTKPIRLGGQPRVHKTCLPVLSALWLFNPNHTLSGNKKTRESRYVDWIQWFVCFLSSQQSCCSHVFLCFIQVPCLVMFL